MSNLHAISPDSQHQEPLNFLKSVVDEDSGQTKNDSDKENDSSSLITSTQEFNVSFLKEAAEDHSMAKEDNDMWEEFYNEDEFQELTTEKKLDELNLLGAGVRNERTLEKVEEEEEDEYVDESNATDTIDSTGNTKENNSDSKADQDTQGRSSKRKRKKRLFKRLRPPSSPTSRIQQQIGGSHPNLSQQSNSIRSDSLDQQSHQFETMSESSGTERKLSRRKQVSRPRCAGPAPSGDRLKQKYQELERLMLKPLPNPAVYVKQTRHQMLRLQGLSSQHHNGAHDPSALPPTGQPAPKDQGKVNGIIQVIDEDSNQVYSTIRTVQVGQTGRKQNARPSSALPRRRPLSGQRQKRPQSAGPARLATSDVSQQSSILSDISVNNSNTRGRRRTGAGVNRKGRSDSSASGGSHQRSDRSQSGSKDREYDSSLEDGTRSRSDSQSPNRAVQATDNHLKNSSNPALRQWLKVKDKEHRRQKLEERKKKRKERAEKQEEEIKRLEFLEKAEEKVKEWMTRKKKEAWKLVKEERKRRKEEERELIEQELKKTESLRGKMFTPIQRPAGKYETEKKSSEQQQQQFNTTTTPHPPKSKFVYKRPVSGRVRLMKLQQNQKDDAKKQEEKKKEMDKLLEEEKARKMRMSYDQWLLKKREEDYAKRQELAKQKALAKSDPELDRIIPEVARRRIENIKRGKKRVECSDSTIDQSVNKSFGGGDFGEDEKNASPSYRLQVSGDKKSLKQRPSSAKPTPTGTLLNPKQSKSPRRPQSANPRVQELMEESQHTDPDNSFKLPFPPELGIPKYVAAKQEKLFSKEVIANSSTDGGGGSTISLEECKENAANEDAGVVTQNVVDDDSQSDILPNDGNTVDAANSDVKSDEEGQGKVEVGQSFFVTDGNLSEEADGNGTRVDDKEEPNSVDGMNDKDESKDEMMSQTLEPASEDTKADSTSNVEGEGGQGDDSHSKNDESEDANEYFLPPLEIGDDDDNDDFFAQQREDYQEEKMEFDDTVNFLDKVGDIDVSELISSSKHVSFSEENTIHEDPLLGISFDAEYFDDGDQQTKNNDEEEEEDEDDLSSYVRNSIPPESTNSENFDYENLDEIEGYEDEDEEAEDERGGF